MVTQHRLTWEALPLFVNMWAGFLMFLLVAVFQFVSRRHASHRAPSQLSRSGALCRAKKGVALLLGALLVIMAAYSIGVFAMDVYHVAITGQTTVAMSPLSITTCSR